MTIAKLNHRLNLTRSPRQCKVKTFCPNFDANNIWHRHFPKIGSFKTDRFITAFSFKLE